MARPEWLAAWWRRADELTPGERVALAPADLRTPEALEARLRELLSQVGLLGDVAVDAEGYGALLELLGPALRADLRAACSRYPHAVALLLVHGARLRYRQGTLWPLLAADFGVALGPGQQRLLHEAFRRATASRVPLPRDRGRPLAQILLHGGVPLHALPELLECVVRPAAEQGLDLRAAARAALREGRPLSRPARRFLRWLPQRAAQLLEALARWAASGGAEVPGPLDRDAVAVLAAAGAGPRSGARRAAPQVRWRPGQGLVLRLPASSRGSWRVVADGRPLQALGHLHEEMALPPAAVYRVTWEGPGGAVSSWTLPGLRTPVGEASLWDGEDGAPAAARSATLAVLVGPDETLVPEPAGAWWVPCQDPDWRGYAAACWEGVVPEGLRVEAAGGAWPVVRPAAPADSVALALEGTPLPGAAPEGVEAPVFAGEPPRLRLRGRAAGARLVVRAPAGGVHLLGAAGAEGGAWDLGEVLRGEAGWVEAAVYAGDTVAAQTAFVLLPPLRLDIPERLRWPGPTGHQAGTVRLELSPGVVWVDAQGQTHRGTVEIPVGAEAAACGGWLRPQAEGAWPPVRCVLPVRAVRWAWVWPGEAPTWTARPVRVEGPEGLARLRDAQLLVALEATWTPEPVRLGLEAVAAGRIADRWDLGRLRPGERPAVQRLDGVLDALRRLGTTWSLELVADEGGRGAPRRWRIAEPGAPRRQAVRIRSLWNPWEPATEAVLLGPEGSVGLEPEPASPGPYHAVPEDGQDRGRVVVVPGAVPPPTEAWRAALASWLAAAWPVAGAAVPEALPGAAPVPASAAEARWLWEALARLGEADPAGEAAVRLGRAVRLALTGEHLVPLLVALGDAAAAGRAPSRAALLAFGLPRLPLGQASTRAVQGMDTAVRTGLYGLWPAFAVEVDLAWAGCEDAGPWARRLVEGLGRAGVRLPAALRAELLDPRIAATVGHRGLAWPQPERRGLVRRLLHQAAGPWPEPGADTGWDRLADAADAAYQLLLCLPAARDLGPVLDHVRGRRAAGPVAFVGGVTVLLQVLAAWGLLEPPAQGLEEDVDLRPVAAADPLGCDRDLALLATAVALLDP